MGNKVLVYQAYGNLEIINQTIFSIFSLLRLLESRENFKILIYTDNKQKFIDYFGSELAPESYVEINSQDIQKWRGKIDFVHRVKIEILMDAAKKFSGSLFYCDGDTYFLTNPMELFARINDRISLMHISEGAIDTNRDPLSKKICKFVKKNHFQVQKELIGIGPSTVMWNAGVLGISEKNKEILQTVLELTDEAYSLYQKHVMEQLAFSYFLQTKTTIIPADSVIYHYWNQKPEYQQAIDQFLKNFPTYSQAQLGFGEFKWPSKIKEKPPEMNWAKRFFRTFRSTKASSNKSK